MVFWFGKEAKVTPPPVGTSTPSSPLELQESLAARLPAHLKPLTTVVVLDVSIASAAAAERKEAPFLDDQATKRADREARQKAVIKPRSKGKSAKI
ncbi:hypothetical protein D9M69_547470 [compost metagenome]